ncbi:MAG: polyprenol monophosphomannose synthase [Bacteroidales bacterium]|nr:polyprenol monophosphomannose synthase [Candidatus Cryptobacteroides aphodequi]
MAENKRLVIIPTYNEIENIEAICRAVFSLDGNFSILVIDDGSPDGTAAKVEELQSEFAGRLHLLQRSGKLGLGTAYITGFKWALEHGFEHICEMDADFSHDPADLPRLFEACEQGGADFSIGSRYKDGVSVVNWPIGRIIMSYYASVYVRVVLHSGIMDSTAGYVCWSRRVLESIDLDAVQMKGYGFQIEMKYTALKLGFKVCEVPVIFVNRKQGTSKMSGSIFGEAFWGVLKLRFRKFKKNCYICKNVD